MHTPNTKTILEVLHQVLNLLGISPENQPKMMGHVEEIIQLTALKKLVEGLNPSDQTSIQKQVQGQQPQEQSKILGEYLKSHYSESEINSKYLAIAAQEVVPSYLKSILAAASEEQRQKVNQFLQSVVA